MSRPRTPTTPTKPAAAPAPRTVTDTLSFLTAFDTIFRPWFAGDSWGVWRIVAKSIFGEPLTPDELATFTACTGRTVAQAAPAKEMWLACGRRAGKDYFVAALVVWLVCFRRYQFNVGERGLVMLLAVDADHAGVLGTYITDLVDSIPQVRAMVTKRFVKYGERRTLFSTGVEVLVKPADKRRIRGRTVVAVVADEIAHWFNEESHANLDKEVLGSVRPGMLGVLGAMLIAISSPYRRAAPATTTRRRASTIRARA